MSESKMGLPAGGGTRFFLGASGLSKMQKSASNRLLIMPLGCIFSCGHNPSLLKNVGFMWSVSDC